MDEHGSWKRAVQDAREAERIAAEVAEAIKAEKQRRGTSYQALAAQRHPLVQAYSDARRQMLEQWERAWGAWNDAGDAGTGR
jgi:phage terminase small subunit